MISILDTNFGATLDAAALQNSASSLGRNTCAETVSFCTMTRMWLVSSFWHICTTLSYFHLFFKSLLVVVHENHKLIHIFTDDLGNCGKVAPLAGSLRGVFFMVVEKSRLAYSNSNETRWKSGEKLRDNYICSIRYGKVS